MNNLTDKREYASKLEELRDEMIRRLSGQGDPRVLGKGEVFMSYPYAQSNRGLYEKIMAGMEVNTGWVYDTDFEPEWVEGQ